MSAPDFSIHEAGVTAARVLAHLHGACFEEAWGEDAVATLLAMPGTFALVGSLGTEPVGFVLVRVVADECEVLAIGVDAGHRGAGHGSRLLAAAWLRAGTAGAHRMILEVADDNAAALRFYAKTGFSPVGRRRGYYARPNCEPVDACILARAAPELRT